MTLVNRVSVFFLTALALCLAGYSVLSYFLIRDHLYDEFDRRLQTALHVLVAAVEVEEDGVKWQPSDHTINIGDEEDVDEVRWVIVDERGRVVDQSRNLDTPTEDERALIEFAKSEHAEEGIAVGSPFWRLLQTRLAAAEPKEPSERDVDEFAEVTVTVARSPAGLQADLWQLVWLVCSLPVVLWIVAAVIGRRFCRRALSPLGNMATRARSMPRPDFHLRLPVRSPPDELTDLAIAFNGLLDQLQQAYEQQRRFTGDAAHQLRTPLTVLRGQIDVALRRPRPAEEYHRVLATLRDQTQELQQLVEALLFLARADDEAALPENQPIHLAGWVPAVLDHWRQHPRGADLVVDVDPGAWVTASPPLLRQALDNLISNAMKYSAPGTPVHLRVWRDRGAVLLEVTDEGMGIAPQDREAIFEPFFRSAQARQSGVEGTGLGLALVARIVHAFGGRIVCSENYPRGSRFSLSLPQRSEKAPSLVEA